MATPERMNQIREDRQQSLRDIGIESQAGPYQGAVWLDATNLRKLVVKIKRLQKQASKPVIMVDGGEPRSAEECELDGMRGLAELAGADTDDSP